MTKYSKDIEAIKRALKSKKWEYRDSSMYNKVVDRMDKSRMKQNWELELEQLRAQLYRLEYKIKDYE